MHYEVSARVFTSKDVDSVQALIQEQFIKIASDFDVQGDTLLVRGISNTFGSINRISIAEVTVRPTLNGYILVAAVEYRPSLCFWAFFVFGLFTTLLWVLPLVFYFSQREMVKRSIIEIFDRTRNEFDQSEQRSGNTTIAGEILELYKLKEDRIITDQEFETKKVQLLR